jgi:phosphate transport system protein
MRKQFEGKLDTLRGEVLKMGQMVEDELKQAIQSLEMLDKDLAHQVVESDAAVNTQRFAIEEMCLELIATQQPVAHDLRVVVAVMNMIVDLERMGDQAKGIAKIVRRLTEHPKEALPPEVKQMGEIVGSMLHQSMTAYAQNSMGLARLAASRDDEVDRLYAHLFSKIMEDMAGTKKEKKIKAAYEILRVAQELERFGDLVTNIVERVMYVATGKVKEISAEPDDAAK